MLRRIVNFRDQAATNRSFSILLPQIVALESQ
jgi:hypothetical protein